MEKGIDYKITKIEKGPLQRFKNQNLLIKKFGEVGLQVYKTITGKRTAEQLRADLDIDPETFAQVLSYMEEAGMVELAPLETEISSEEVKEEAKEVRREKAREEEKEELPQIEEEKEEFEKPVEEDIEIKPIEQDIEPISEEETAEKEEEKEELPPIEEEKESAEETKIEFEKEEEIKPIGEEEAGEETLTQPEEEAPVEEKAEGEYKEEEIAPVTEEEENDVEELTPVEKIIKNKYGEVGIKVYNLIDGQKTAEEIMKETGLTESKLVEILDFMDEEGIIKLEYPGEKKGKTSEVPTEEKVESQEFKPIVEEDAMPERESFLREKSIEPIEIPIKTPEDIVKSVYLKTNTLLKFGDKGSKILELIDGKKDVIEIALKTNSALYEVATVVNFLLEGKGIMLTPLTRTDIRKKYGDEGYAVYKKYGKHGLMLYELVGHDMRIGEMAKRVYKDPKNNVDKIVDMFLFIHQILKIDLPVDKELLYKELQNI
ncbi:hypothetical protein HYT84_04100 [Candidatus Micrarchaeota archaeon]|nr:hypothetical protein [Candidatus Micrarchaeota archaeon]